LEHCRDICENLGIPFFAGKADVPAVAESLKIGVEEAGRKLRYEFLQTIARQGFQRIATGHTLDDNLESMLLHLTRGTGMRGLCGIPMQRDNIIRPILFVSRQRTHDYCEQNGIPYVSDSYNEDESYARNLVRARVVSELKGINPAVAEHAFTTAQILTEENALLDAIAASHLAGAEVEPSHPFGFIEKRFRARWQGLQSLPLAIVRRCIRQAAAMYGGSLDYGQTQSLAEAIHRSEKAAHTAEGAEVSVTVDETGWSVTRGDVIQPFRQMVTLDGETIADDLGWSLAVWHDTSNPAIDTERTKGDVYLRSLKPGDRIDPPGRGEAKPLSERLARAGIPEQVRGRLPIVCDMVGPIWAPIVGPDKRCVAPESTTTGLSLELREIAEP
jgi:tRNA(Ile)-lysidine synthase